VGGGGYEKTEGLWNGQIVGLKMYSSFPRLGTLFTCYIIKLDCRSKL